MFRGLRNLSSLDISNFDTNSVTNMSSMFVSCYSLMTLKFNKANFLNVTTYNNMFGGVSNDINIFLKDDTQVNWLKDKFTNLTNVVVEV